MCSIGLLVSYPPPRWFCLPPDCLLVCCPPQFYGSVGEVLRCCPALRAARQLTICFDTTCKWAACRRLATTAT